jgi:hypothetical protein
MSTLQLGRKALIRFPLVRNRREQTNPVASSTCLSEPAHHTQRKRLWKFSLSIPERASESSCISGSISSMLKLSLLVSIPINLYKWSYPRNRPWRPIGLWDVKDSILSRQSLTDGGKDISPEHQPRSTPQKKCFSFWQLISVRGWVNPRA